MNLIQTGIQLEYESKSITAYVTVKHGHGVLYKTVTILIKP